MAKRTVDAVRTLSISTPEDLDKLLDWVRATAPAVAVLHEGEHLFAAERLVVSPAAGVFEPNGIADHTHIFVGTVIGHIGDTEVRSPFEGILQSYTAVSGERVTLRQPIAWLRTV
jgi:[acyl-carrier-protein] S-malonyltransferase